MAARLSWLTALVPLLTMLTVPIIVVSDPPHAAVRLAMNVPYSSNAKINV